MNRSFKEAIGDWKPSGEKGVYPRKYTWKDHDGQELVDKSCSPYRSLFSKRNGKSIHNTVDGFRIYTRNRIRRRFLYDQCFCLCNRR